MLEITPLKVAVPEETCIAVVVPESVMGRLIVIPEPRSNTPVLDITKVPDPPNAELFVTERTPAERVVFPL